MIKGKNTNSRNGAQTRPTNMTSKVAPERSNARIHVRLGQKAETSNILFKRSDARVFLPLSQKPEAPNIRIVVWKVPTLRGFMLIIESS